MVDPDPDKTFRDQIRSDIRDRASRGAHQAPQNIVADVVQAVSPGKHALLPSPRVLNRAAKVAKKTEINQEFALDPEANFKNLDDLVIPLSMRTHHGRDTLLGIGGEGPELVYVFGCRDHFDVLMQSDFLVGGRDFRKCSTSFLSTIFYYDASCMGSISWCWTVSCRQRAVQRMIPCSMSSMEFFQVCVVFKIAFLFVVLAHQKV